MKLARNAAALFILQVKQSRGEFAQIVIGGVKLDGALTDLLFQLALRAVQSGAVATHEFTSRDDCGGACGEYQHAHCLWAVGNTQ